MISIIMQNRSGPTPKGIEKSDQFRFWETAHLPLP